MNRHEEIAKYERVYTRPDYGMSDARKDQAVETLREFHPACCSYLDVSTGRGEMLDAATEIGFTTVQGTEVVPALVDRREDVRWADAIQLPFGARSWDVVSLLDVIEHLVPGDDELACRELARVARRGVIITANNRPSVYDGVEHHINIRSYEEWNDLLWKWLGGAITWHKDRQAKASMIWSIRYE